MMNADMIEAKDMFAAAKKASRSVARLDDAKRAEVLAAVSDALEASVDTVLAANAGDLARMSEDNPLYDRLRLTPSRLASIASDIRNVASLPSPLGRVLDERTLENGLHLKKVSVPFGVIGVVYEARPNVTYDVFSLCFKSGSACVLKGGRDADSSNRAAVALIRDVLVAKDVDPDCIQLLPPTHEAAADLLGAVGYVDLVIPRGGRKLIDFVRDNARVPVIETGAGVVDSYFDMDGDLEIGKNVVTNAKTRRVSVCNALDCLIVHSGRLADLPSLCSRLCDVAGGYTAKPVRIFADERAYSALEGSYPSELLFHADDTSFGTEFMDYAMALKTVDSLDDALEHIARYGSGHSESIVTENPVTAARFHSEVDAACVYVNAPTSFTDGAQFGLGAEIGISTQKLGARGPMGLEEITTCKWLIEGRGQTRA